MQIHLIYRMGFPTRPNNIMKQFTKSMTDQFSSSSLSRCFSLVVAVITTILAFSFSNANAQDKHPGEAIYQAKCLACHQANGAGLPNLFPPLAESEWVNGPEENLVKIQLRGLNGPITVKGNEFNQMMPANATMSDQEIADVLSYVRSNLGNSAPAITAETVKKIRAKVGDNVTPLTVADLIDPTKPVAAVVDVVETTSEPTELAGFKPAKGNGSNPVILWTIGIIAVCTLPVLFGLAKN